MPPAARLTDLHTCPMVTVLVPHVGGPILPPCEPTVLIGYLPAARVTDMLTCVGPPDVIGKGSASVLIGNLMAARLGDPTVHGGVIVSPCCPTVIIGDVPGTALAAAATAVNPGGGTINCGNIIDAVYKRLTGQDPNAVAPTTQDGSWSQINSRYNTTINFGSSFNAAFSAVQAGGNGTTAVVGIKYSPGTVSHVLILANDHGTVGLVEGQGGGAAITTPAAANAQYNSNGLSNIGYGIVPPGTRL